jgi:hypothetical protein
MARKDLLSALFCGVALLLCADFGKATDIDAKSFRCIRKMIPVRQFYVDNLQSNLDATLAAANSATGAVYPPGSVIQLIPGEAMVKHDKGFNSATHDWEFFELDVSKDGTQIRKRGAADVVNRFGGNCFDCYVPAAAQWELSLSQSSPGCITTMSGYNFRKGQVPLGDICTATNRDVIRSPRRRGRAAPAALLRLVNNLGAPRNSSLNVRHEQSVGHSLLKILQHAGLSSGHADRQRFTVRDSKLDDMRAVGLPAVDHDAVLGVHRVVPFFFGLPTFRSAL